MWLTKDLIKSKPFAIFEEYRKFSIIWKEFANRLGNGAHHWIGFNDVWEREEADIPNRICLSQKWGGIKGSHYIATISVCCSEVSVDDWKLKVRILQLVFQCSVKSSWVDREKLRLTYLHEEPYRVIIFLCFFLVRGGSSWISIVKNEVLSHLRCIEPAYLHNWVRYLINLYCFTVCALECLEFYVFNGCCIVKNCKCWWLIIYIILNHWKR